MRCWAQAVSPASERILFQGRIRSFIAREMPFFFFSPHWHEHPPFLECPDVPTESCSLGPGLVMPPLLTPAWLGRHWGNCLLGKMVMFGALKMPQRVRWKVQKHPGHYHKGVKPPCLKTSVAALKKTSEFLTVYICIKLCLLGWFCGGLFLIHFTKSNYMYYHSSFWPYQEKAKRKTQCFPEFVHCSFMKWEDHKVIKASSKRMADFSNEHFSSLWTTHQPFLIKSVATLCVCALAVDQMYLRYFPVWSRLNWTAKHRRSAIDFL